MLGGGACAVLVPLTPNVILRYRHENAHSVLVPLTIPVFELRPCQLSRCPGALDPEHLPSSPPRKRVPTHVPFLLPRPPTSYSTQPLTVIPCYQITR
jgi:hypothetical protein